jgi:lycopene cyclase domain-containing protein
VTYFGFLARFLIAPLTLVGGLTLHDRHRRKLLPAALRGWPAWVVLLAHMAVALLYTTPWDNYLVATGVWWYDTDLVTGIVLGYVPLEEYTFFVLQTLLTGLWLLALARRVPLKMGGRTLDRRLRRGASLVALLLWLGSITVLLSGWRPGTYLALELAWALLPILGQLAFGADILWRYRRLILLALMPPTLYLCAADALAIGSGTWTIDPGQSVGVYLGSVLPLEEFVFFLLTNTLVVFGMVLVLARESQVRTHPRLRSLTARIGDESTRHNGVRG